MNRKMSKFIVVLAVSLFLTASLQAGSVTFSLNFEFSGATPPAGPAPWVTITLDDQGTPGSVNLTISTSGLIGTEFLKQLTLNLNPALNPNSLVFAKNNAVANTGVVSTGVNAFKPDGDGFFDIQIVFPSAQANRFTAGLTASFTITGIAGLTAQDFNFLSAPPPGGGPGPFFVAAHIQGIGPGGANSGWVTQTVPEPTSLFLLGAGLLGLGLFRRRFTADL